LYIGGRVNCYWLIVIRYWLIACLAFAQANAGGPLRSEASKAGYLLSVIRYLSRKKNL